MTAHTSPPPSTPTAALASGGSVALAICAAILLATALALVRVVFEPVAFALFLVALAWSLQRALAKQISAGLALIVTLLSTLAVLAVFALGTAWSVGQIGS